MLIEILDTPDGDKIAREDASGGEFFRRADGSVWYRHEYEVKPMHVAPDEATFRSAATALNRYTLSGRRLDPNDDEANRVLVRQLARDLHDAGVLPAPDESFWSLIVEQAEDGLL
jgi:hypothetical protein